MRTLLRVSATLASTAVAASLSLVSLPASATVDGMLTTTVTYRHPQIDGYCYAELPISAQIGIPPASVAEAAVAPAYVLRSGGGTGGFETLEVGGRTYVNINAAAELDGIVHSYVNDSIEGDVVGYQAKLDVSALGAARGSSVEGRSQTIVQSKLALLAIARSLQELSSGGLFSLRVEFVGLPDQTDLPGARLHATTQYPYSGGSPLLASYEEELVAAECPLGYAFSSKADDIGGEAPSPAPVDATAPKPKKCSVAGVGEPSGMAGLAPWLLAAAAVAVRRRRA